jgi:hypothetical protein
MTMIERVAKALYGASAEFPDHTWEAADEDTRVYWSARARAAIEAMREPTLEMFEAGRPYMVDGPHEVWREMIDAALEGRK